MQKLTDLTKAEIGSSDYNKKRAVQIEYSGWKVPMVVKNVDDDLDFRVKAALKGWACETGHLTALPGATELCSNEGCQVTTWGLPFLKAAQQTRVFVTRLHQGETKKDGETLVVQISDTPKNCKHLRYGFIFSHAVSRASFHANKLKISGADKLLWIDYEFLKHVSSQGGRERLEQKFIKTCLPEEGTLMTLSKAADGCTAICKSELYSFCGSVAQGTLKAACKASEFLENVWPLLPRVVVMPLPGTASDDEVAPGFGKASSDKLWADTRRRSRRRLMPL
eukprot:3118926-Amphidinium_carterae.2